MGIMKRVRTAMSLKMFPTDSSEKAIYQDIIAREERYRLYRADEALRNQDRCDDLNNIPIYFRHEFVGKRPIREGRYMVFDKDTLAVQMVAISKASNGHLVAWALEEQRPVPLDDYNLRSFRWFRMSYLDQEDQKMIRELPIAKTP